MFDLADKNALVTGASGGIGGAIARALHAAGARVGLSGTRAGALDALAGELGDGAFAVPADLSSANGAKTLVKDAEVALGDRAVPRRGERARRLGPGARARRPPFDARRGERARRAAARAP